MSEILEHYVELITDPAHTLVETTFIFAEFLIFSVMLNRAKKVWHRIIDREHGVHHPQKRPRRYKGNHRPKPEPWPYGDADSVWVVPN